MLPSDFHNIKYGFNKKWAHQNIAIGRKLLAYCYCHPTITKWKF